MRAVFYATIALVALMTHTQAVELESEQPSDPVWVRNGFANSCKSVCATLEIDACMKQCVQTRKGGKCGNGGRKEFCQRAEGWSEPEPY